MGRMPQHALNRSGAGMARRTAIQPEGRSRALNPGVVSSGAGQRIYRPQPTTIDTANFSRTTPRARRAEGRRGGVRRHAQPRVSDGESNDLRDRDGRNPRNRQVRDGNRERRDGHRDSWRERHRDWHKRHEGDPDFADKHRRWHRQHYPRDWWRRHYTTFVLFGGGYYYWSGGYWYPAYGYDPYYSNYMYDAPIYSYDGAAPGEIISRVQAILQERGYYRGAVDGAYGPRTRQALLDYQADHGLSMTGEIDEQTLRSMGL